MRLPTELEIVRTCGQNVLSPRACTNTTWTNLIAEPLALDACAGSAEACYTFLALAHRSLPKLPNWRTRLSVQSAWRTLRSLIACAILDHVSNTQTWRQDCIAVRCLPTLNVHMIACPHVAVHPPPPPPPLPAFVAGFSPRACIPAPLRTSPILQSRRKSQGAKPADANTSADIAIVGLLGTVTLVTVQVYMPPCMTQ